MFKAPAMLNPRQFVAIPTWLRCAAICSVVMCVVMDSVDAAPFGRRIHHWGRFRPGSWSVVRQGIETVDDRGEVVDKSTSELRTELAAASDDDFVLRVQSSLEFAGRKLESPPQELRQGLLGERGDAAAAVVELPEEDVVIQGRAYRCQVSQSETNVDGRRQVVKSWISADVSPYLLRKVTTTYDSASSLVLVESVSEVVSLASRQRVLARTRPVAEVRTIQRHPRGQTMSHAVCCPEIPGGVVSQTSQEFDAQGQLVRRTRMELVDFETK